MSEGSPFRHTSILAHQACPRQMNLSWPFIQRLSLSSNVFNGFRRVKIPVPAFSMADSSQRSSAFLKSLALIFYSLFTSCPAYLAQQYPQTSEQHSVCCDIVVSVQKVMLVCPTVTWLRLVQRKGWPLKYPTSCSSTCPSLGSRLRSESKQIRTRLGILVDFLQQRLEP
jgi:hypothetical protein